MRWSALLVCLVGCRGAADEPAPFEVASTVPADGATGVRADAVIEVSFTGDADPASIVATTFRVTCDGVPVAGAITYDAETRTATFSAERRAPLLAGCEVVLDRGIRGVDGGALAQDVSWTFHVTDGTWSPGASLATGAFTDAPEPDVGVDASGNAVAVWSHAAIVDETAPEPVVREDVWAATYLADVGWSPPVPLETDELDSARHARVAVAPGGRAIAVWEQDDAGATSVWANVYDPASGWGGATRIEDDAGAATQVDVGIDGAGAAWAIWVLAGTAVRVARYDAADGWQPPQTVTTAADPIWYARVAVAAGGPAVAVWNAAGPEDPWPRLHASVHDGDAWSAPAPVDPVGGTGDEPHAAVADDGAVVVAWQRPEGVSTYTWANRYVPGDGWGVAERVAGDGVEHAWFPDVAIAPTGDAIVVALHGVRLVAARFDGAAWAPATTFFEGNGHAARVAIDPSGNAIAAWADHSNVLSSRYLPGVGWAPVDVVAQPQPGAQEAVDVAIGADGTGVVVWEYQAEEVVDGVTIRWTEIWASARR